MELITRIDLDALFSYNPLTFYFNQNEALKWIIDQTAWKRSEGRDHIFPIHHPWSFGTVRNFIKKRNMAFARYGLYRKVGGKVCAKLGSYLSNAKDVIITEGTARHEGKLAAQK